MNTSTRIVLGCICAGFLAVSSLPNTREVPAAASDGAFAPASYDLSDVAPAAEYCAPTAEPMTVCTPEGCYVVQGQPVRSVVKTSTRVATAPARAVVRTVQSRQVFRSNERFMQRGPARRVFGRVGRGVCRVAFAPIRWLRCR